MENSEGAKRPVYDWREEEEDEYGGPFFYDANPGGVLYDAKRKRVDAARRDLEEVPEEVWLHRDALCLGLDRNKLTELSPEIGRMKDLEVLSLEYNQLETLPAEVGALWILKTIDISFNYIETLPPEIKQWALLEKLVAKFNMCVLFYYS